MSVATVAAGAAASARDRPSLLDVDAAARATGNARSEAFVVARALLSAPSAMQVIGVHVDRVGSHRVASVTLLGTKLRHRIAPAAFLKEATHLIDVAFAADAALEEVDLRALVPEKAYTDEEERDADEGDRPPEQTVFTLTVRRSAQNVREAFWDPAWREELDRVR